MTFLKPFALAVALMSAAPLSAQVFEGPQSEAFAADYAAAEAARDAFIAGDIELAVRLAEPLAEAGNPVAQNVMGLAYDEEKGPFFDPMQALIWLERAADQDYAKAWHNIGDLYSNGRGPLAADVEQALSAYVEASHLNYEVSFEAAIGLIYDQDEVDEALLLDLLERGQASYPQNVYLHTVEADTYYYGWGRATDYERSLGLFEEIAASSGDAYAQWSAGYQYFYAEGTEYNPVKAREYFELAAAQDHPGSLGTLSQTYIWGYGVEPDYELARSYAERGQALGNAMSALSLGELYYLGHGVEIDNVQARTYFEEARDGGNVDGHTYLADMAYLGQGEPQDHAKALGLFLAALDVLSSDYYANFSIGFMLMRGEGAPRDVARASEYLLVARTSGSSYALAELALVYGDPAYAWPQQDPVLAMGYCMALAQELPDYRQSPDEFDETILTCDHLEATLPQEDLDRAAVTAETL